MPLKPREEEFDFESKVGKITSVNDLDRSSGGFYCELCSVLLRDSISYLDHVNGGKHLKKAGVSKTTVRAGVSDVLNQLKSGKLKSKKSNNLIENAPKKPLNVKPNKKIKTSQNDQKTPEATPEEKELESILGFSAFGKTSKK